MGGSIHPVTNDPEFTQTPHREFNLWMDPEAARRVLRSPWPRIVVTTVALIDPPGHPVMTEDVGSAPAGAAR